MMKSFLLAMALILAPTTAFAIDFNCSPKPICLKQQAAAEKAKKRQEQAKKVNRCDEISKVFFSESQAYRNEQGAMMLNCVLDSMQPAAKSKLRFH